MANRGLSQNSSPSFSRSVDSDNSTSSKKPSSGDELELNVCVDDCNKDVLTFQDVGILRKVLGVPPDCDLRPSSLGDDCHDPPSGYFTVFLEYFTSGLQFPPQPLLVELVKSLGMSFSQLTPNAVIVFSAFCHKIIEIGMSPSVELFHSLFVARRNQPDAYIHFQPRGDRLDLATIRARKNMVERRSPFAGNNRAFADRGAHITRDPVRRGVSSGRLENARGSEPQAHKKTVTSSSTKALDSRFANGEGGEARKRVPEEVRMKTGEEELRYPKKSRVEDLGATSKNSKNIFVDGVNHKDKADSFWDLNDPEIGWKKGRSIVGDFDMIHLMSQSTDSFAYSLAWNSCQGLSLASAMRVREEKLRNDQNKLREEIVRLKEDNCRLVEEKKKTKAELLQAQIKFADKVKDFAVLEEKHSTELKTGGLFLGSETGKIFLKSVEDKSVQTFKASDAFREDVLDQAMVIHDDVVLDCRRQLRKSGVSEDIVMLIEPSVLEVDKVSIDDIPLGDAEMIEALIPRSVDDEA